MQVRATQRGFIYWVRHPGEVFEIAEHHFSPDWMEKIESTDDAAKAAAVPYDPNTVAYSVAPPPADDDHVAPGASLFSDPTKTAPPPADAPPPDSPAARHWWQGKEPVPTNPTTLDVK